MLIGNPFGNRGEIKKPAEINEAAESGDGKKMDVKTAKMYLKASIIAMDGRAKSEFATKDINKNSDISVKDAGESYSDKVEKQEKEIGAVENHEKNFDRTNTHETGNYGEMKTDQDLREKGYERISNEMVTDIDGKTHLGLDGVYHNPDGEPQYLIVDAKYGSSQLGETKDGKQMSDTWIDARLDKDLGPEKADEIRLEKILNPENVGCYVAHIDVAGNVTYERLDADANVIEKDVKING